MAQKSGFNSNFLGFSPDLKSKISAGSDFKSIFAEFSHSLKNSLNIDNETCPFSAEFMGDRYKLCRLKCANDSKNSIDHQLNALCIACKNAYNSARKLAIEHCAYIQYLNASGNDPRCSYLRQHKISKRQARKENYENFDELQGLSGLLKELITYLQIRKVVILTYQSGKTFLFFVIAS